MASFNAYASTLRGDHGAHERTIAEGVPFFVPQLAKVKTSVVCQTTNQHLLFCYEKAPSVSAGAGPGAGTSGGGNSEMRHSYRKQGNQELYSNENLKKRQRLLDDKQVVAAIARFWDTFPHIRLGHQFLDKRDYIDVFMKFYKALVAPSEFSMGEARRIVERDWWRDVGESEVMTKVLFFRALFEVADIWTVGIGPEIYVSFLNKLFERVTMTVFDQEKSMWITVFADLDKVRSLLEPKAGASATASTSTVAPIGPTNQDLDSAQQATLPGTSSTIAPVLGRKAGSSPKPKPPLLKKKTMSVPKGLGSPTHSSILETIRAETMSGSLRRLPDLPIGVAHGESIRTTQGIASRSPKVADGSHMEDNDAIPTSPLSSGILSSRSDGRIAQSAQKSSSFDRDPAADDSGRPPFANSASISPTRSFQRSMSVRRDLSTILQQRRSTAEDKEDPAIPPPPPHDLPPQQVRLSMPSIYLSPEITPAHAGERAARRRIQESMKLAQRLRRITF